MSAAEALKGARAAGIHLGIDSDDLALEASLPPPAAVLDALSRHKAEIVALLRPAKDGWSAEDWQVFFDERAGIGEFDGGLPRDQAEARAFACCAAEWLNRNLVRSPPGLCPGCRVPDQRHDPLASFVAEPTSYAWLHSGCWTAWHDGRKAEAVAALSKLEITNSRTDQ